MTPARWRKVRLTAVWLLSAVPFTLLFWDAFLMNTLMISLATGTVFAYLFLAFVVAEKRDLDAWGHYLGSFVLLLLAFPALAPKRILFFLDRSKLEEAAGIVRDTGYLPTTFKGGVQTIVDFADLEDSECLWIERGPTGGIGYCHFGPHRTAQFAIVAISLGDNWYYVIED